jgi:CRISPR-associated protein Cmr5
MTKEQTPSQQQLSEQARASDAWNNIEKVSETEEKKYGTLARKLPALIQTNGLGQALAFLRAKGGKNKRDAHNVLFSHVSNWVVTQVDGSGDLLEWVIRQDSSQYRRATAEAIAYAMWLRRFAEAKGWGEAGGET